MRWLTLLLFLAATPASLAARVADEYTLKAAYLYNFAKFVEWPAGDNRAAGEIRLCVFGEDEFEGALQKIEGRSAQNRIIHVNRLRRITKEDAACHILFVSRSQGKAALQSAVQTLGNGPVLTVSDIEDAANQGCMIEFRNVDQHIKFVIDVTNSRNAGLNISSFLLQLALEVRGGGR